MAQCQFVLSHNHNAPLLVSNANVVPAGVAVGMTPVLIKIRLLTTGAISDSTNVFSPTIGIRSVPVGATAGKSDTFIVKFVPDLSSAKDQDCLMSKARNHPSTTLILS